MKKIFLLMFFLMTCTISSFAQNSYSINGIKYNILDSFSENGEQCVSVEADNPDLLTGSITIEACTPNGNKVTKITSKGFRNCKNITGLSLPSTLEEIPEGCLAGCTSLEFLSVPFVGDKRYAKSDTPTRNSCLGILFGQENYEGSQSWYIPYTQNSWGAIKDMSITFYIPKTLNEIYIEGGYILGGSVAYCPSTIKKITLGTSVYVHAFGMDENSDTDIWVNLGANQHDEQAPILCKTLVFVTYDLKKWCETGFGSNWPIVQECQNSRIYLTRSYFNFLEGEYEIPEGTTIIKNQTFQSNNDITSVILPSSLDSIGWWSFNWCNNIQTVTFKDGATVAGGFRGCSNLKTVKLSSTTEKIGREAFAGTSIEQLEIPETVTSIGYEAFYACSNLVSLNILSKTPPSLGEKAIPASTICYVPKESLNAYLIADGWKDCNIAVEGSSEEINTVATPNISFDGKNVKFTCETENVTFHSTCTIVSDTNKTYDNNSITLSSTYEVSVYATKDGCRQSEIAKKQITIDSKNFGDIDSNGKLDVNDVSKLIDVLLKK